jgi:hypothetical protein
MRRTMIRRVTIGRYRRPHITAQSKRLQSFGLGGECGTVNAYRGQRKETFMPDAYVIEVFGRTAGIVARDSQSNSFNFFSAAPRFNAIEGRHFSDPLAAERAARVLAQYGSLPRRGETEYSRPNTRRGRLG